MYASMTLDGSEAFESRADDEHLEMRLRSLWNTVHVALVFDHQMLGFERFCELVLNSFLASHGASLPRSTFMRESMRESPQRVDAGTAVSFASCAIQRRP